MHCAISAASGWRRSRCLGKSSSWGNSERRDRQASTHRTGGKTRPVGMKFSVFGAGAIGGMLGVKLAAAGVDVTFIARGPHLAAMQANGVTLRSGGETISVRPRCLGDATAAGVQDFVIVTLKAH